jgi:hypothetical protein
MLMTYLGAIQEVEARHKGPGPLCGAVPTGPFYQALIPKMIVIAQALVALTLFFFTSHRMVTILQRWRRSHREMMPTLETMETMQDCARAVLRCHHPSDLTLAHWERRYGLDTSSVVQHVQMQPQMI